MELNMFDLMCISSSDLFRNLYKYLDSFMEVLTINSSSPAAFLNLNQDANKKELDGIIIEVKKRQA